MTAIFVACIAALASIISAVIAKKQNKKIDETHKQVTVNSHSSDTPTVLDLINDLRDEVRDTNKLVVNHIIWHLNSEEKK